MTWYPDLSEYTYLPESVPEDAAVSTVGWLDGQHDFPTGDVPQEFINELGHMCASSSYARTRGWQSCQLPHPDGEADYPVTIEVGGNKISLGSAEVRVTAEDGTVLAAPNLIWHYVTAHRYRPPASFIEAVRSRRLAPAE